MTIPIKIAHLCGSLGQALAIVDDETWLYQGKERRRPTGNDIRFFFQHGLEGLAIDQSAVDVLNESKLWALLDLESRRFEVLHSLLMGLDAELDEVLRKRSIRRANRLLADPGVADFAERRFLKPLSQQSWDLAGALRLARAEGQSSVERLYSIVNSPLLLRLEDEILGWASAQAYSSVERAAEIEKAYDAGLVAAVATALHNAPNEISTRIFLAKNVHWDRRLAAHLVNRLTPQKVVANGRLDAVEDTDDEVVESKRDVFSQVGTRIRTLLDEYNLRKRREGHRERTDVVGTDAYEAALKQVDWIARRFESGHAEAAWQDVVRLAERQLADGDPDKFAMSLTNLATRLVQHEGVASALCDIAALCAPEDPAVWTARAELLRKQSHLNEALAAYERTIEDFPHYAVARNGRAETLRSLGRFDEALAAYEGTMEDFPQNAFARNGRAETLRSLGRFDEALAAYEGTMEDFPQDAVARNGRAETLRSLGRFDEALAAYERTMEDFPQNAVARNGRAETLRSLGRFDEALAAYERTMEDFPQDAFARNGRAETLRSLGRFDEALAAYERAIEDFPQDAVARTGRAETLRSLGRFDEALAAYERAIEDFPQDAVARSGRAETLRSLGRFDEALAAYERTMEDFPQDAVARSGRAETLRSLGRFDEALAAYERAMEDFPQNAVARTGRAETLRSLGRFDEALAAYERTVEDFPQDAFARTGRAETLRSLGRFDEALAAYERTMEDFPQDAVARNGRVVVLGELGRFAEAREVLKKIVRSPRSATDWVAVHIFCMIDVREGATSETMARLEQAVSTCPYREQRFYFETSLAVVRIALRRNREAGQMLAILSDRPEVDAEERAALKIMKAHAEAADGDLNAARDSLAAASNVVSYEQFRLLQLRREVERRFGLGTLPTLVRPEEIAASNRTLIRLETGFLIESATRRVANARLAA